MSRVLPERERWRLEKQVTLGVICAMTLQAGAALVWAGAAGERISQLERRADLAEPLAERLARIEAQVSELRAGQKRIESKLDQGDSAAHLADRAAGR